MKKLLTAAFSTMIISQSVFAAANDVSASVAITGTATDSQETSCSVNVSQSSITLKQNISELITEGAPNASGAGSTVHLTLTGAAKCNKLAQDGKIRYKFLGTPSSSWSKSLVNDDVSETGAKGVGVSIYDATNNIIAVNDSKIITTTGYDINLAMVALNAQEQTAGNYRGSLMIEVDTL